MSEAKNERGLALGLAIIAALVGLLVLTLVFESETEPMGIDLGGVIGCIYIMSWGFLFLESYYFSHKCFFLRGLMWVCENSYCLGGRWMAIFYFLLAFVLGGLGLLDRLGLIQLFG